MKTVFIIVSNVYSFAYGLFPLRKLEHIPEEQNRHEQSVSASGNQKQEQGMLQELIKSNILINRQAGQSTRNCCDVYGSIIAYSLKYWNNHNLTIFSLSKLESYKTEFSKGS